MGAASLKERLGHSNIQITMRYAHLVPDHLRAAVASLNGILAAPADVAADVADASLTRPHHKSVTRIDPAVATVA